MTICRFIVLAKRIIIDEQTSNASAIDIVDTISLHIPDLDEQHNENGYIDFPLNPPLKLLCVVEQDSESSQTNTNLRLAIKPPDSDAILANESIPIDFSEVKMRRIIANIQALLVNGPGRYEIQVTEDQTETVLGSIPVSVDIVDQLPNE